MRPGPRPVPRARQPAGPAQLPPLPTRPEPGPPRRAVPPPAPGSRLPSTRRLRRGPDSPGLEGGPVTGPRRPPARDVALRALSEGIEACGRCRPDAELGYSA
ncbi:DUF6233 domain-containing protein [Streptomyces sp. CoT10]|uniref:DUF6233 domain-containing protein n=1 Tax=Streptomyces sp. CoT10 TaxID=2875762 RepID=UPI001CD22D51